MSSRPSLGIAVILLLSAIPRSATALDANGKWRFTSGVITQVTQSGSSLSFMIGDFAFSGSLTPAGIFTDYNVSASSPVMAAINGRFMPSGNLFDGRGVVAGFNPGDPPSAASLAATRCTCDDGNAMNGDGCSAECRVEPCWTCTGDPSVCTPAGDGSVCEDGSACTTGETCAGGVCGGGTPVSPCVDMTGRWNRHTVIAAPGSSSDTTTDVVQRGTDLIIANYVGTIDPSSGAFDVRAPNLELFCYFDPLIGSVAPGGETYVATGSLGFVSPAIGDECENLPVDETGTRCGSGTVDLVEECDDGNAADGDGCNAACQVEQCWTCSGDPSTCVSQPRSPCTGSTQPERSTLRLWNDADDSHDMLVWAWNKGGATTLDDLGDPPGGDDYALCLYDESAAPMLVFRAAVAGAGTCDGKPCWKQVGDRQFVYKSKATPDGVAVVSLKSGTAGTARALVKGRGVHLSDHPYPLPLVPLPTPLRVQLQGSNGLCLETRHTAGSVLKNEAGVFKARGAP